MLNTIHVLQAGFDLPPTAAQPKNPGIVLKTNPTEDGCRNPLRPGREQDMQNPLFLARVDDFTGAINHGPYCKDKRFYLQAKALEAEEQQ